MPAGLRMECMAVSMALWKLTSAQYATRSCLLSLCAIRLPTSCFAMDRSNVFAIFSTYVGEAQCTPPQEAHVGCEFGRHKCGCAWLAMESAGTAIGVAFGTRDRVASAVSECLYARPPYGPRMFVYATGTQLWRVSRTVERRDHTTMSHCGSPLVI